MQFPEPDDGARCVSPCWFWRCVCCRRREPLPRPLRRRRPGLFSSLDDVSRILASRVAEECGEDADRTLVRFQQAILELPLKQRLVFNLRYYDRMPYGQIARVLGQREETLKVNYHHAVQKLKEKLTREL